MTDQDFFFDEEDEQQKPKDKPAKKASAAKASRPAAAGTQVSFWQQSVTMTITAFVAAIALLLGLIVGIVLPVGEGGTSGVPSPTGDVSAPSLSPEQLESGELPEGHPPLDEMMGGQAPDAGAEGTTTP